MKNETIREILAKIAEQVLKENHCENSEFRLNSVTYLGYKNYPYILAREIADRTVAKLVENYFSEAVKNEADNSGN